MKYFSIAELTYSRTALKEHIDNTPDKESLEHLLELGEFLDGLRMAWGSAIIISSGYRCRALNSHRSINGSKTSVHMKGWAADMVPANGRFKEFVDFTVKYISGKKFDQCIIEKNSKGSQWLHFGLKGNVGEQRQMIFNINI